MTCRPTPIVLAALAMSLAVAACGAGSSPEPLAVARPVDTTDSHATAGAAGDDTGDEPTADGDGAVPPRSYPDHEVLTEGDPTTDGSDGEASTSTTEAPAAPDGDASTSTSTTERKPLYVSQKREPTGPGVPGIPAYSQTDQEVEYFACVTFRESSNDPTVINGSSGAAGLFQFLQSTWDIVARRIGRYDLVGVNPALASVPTQRYMAHVLFLWQGASPWVSDGCQVPGRGTTTTTTTTPTTPSTTTSTSSTTTTSTAPSPTSPAA